MSDSITVLVNDEPKVIPSGETVATLVERLALRPRGIAVALNTEVLPQQEWPERKLKIHDSILIITATQGG